MNNHINKVLATAAERAHSLAKEKGFWPEGRANRVEGLLSALALLHAEVSELVEAVRKKPKAPCDKPIELTCEEEELADIFIRLLDYCGARGIDLGRAVQLKHDYNKTRPHKHGKQA